MAFDSTPVVRKPRSGGRRRRLNWNRSVDVCVNTLKFLDLSSGVVRRSRSRVRQRRQNTRVSDVSDRLGEKSEERFLGTKVWARDDNAAYDNQIGKGRDDSCKCPSPGSQECIEVHKREERERLKPVLGKQYAEWGLDHW